MTNQLEHLGESDTPDPPVLFVGKWAKKYIRELEADRERLRQENIDLRAKVAAARIRIHPGHPAYKILNPDDPDV